jgi:hypothetical protein
MTRAQLLMSEYGEQEFVICAIVHARCGYNPRGHNEEIL